MTRATVRRATRDDYDDVVGFTTRTWADRETGDYVPDVFHDWVDADGPDQRTVVVEVGGGDGETRGTGEGSVAGLCQGKLLSPHEAWLQGMRVDPEYRGEGHGLRLVDHLFAWAREQGATVARNLVFGWNDAGLGQSLAAGFAPRTSFRWARPAPEPGTPDPPVDDDPAAAWSYWARSEARDVLGGLALDGEHTWAVSELTRERLRAVAERERTFAVKREGTRGMALRVRTTERESDAGADGEPGDGTETLAEYAVGAWADADAADALVTAIRDDAATLGADSTRVLVPESPRHVAEVAAARTEFSEHADFVLEADLTGRE